MRPTQKLPRLKKIKCKYFLFQKFFFQISINVNVPKRLNQHAKSAAHCTRYFLTQKNQNKFYPWL